MIDLRSPDAVLSEYAQRYAECNPNGRRSCSSA